MDNVINLSDRTLHSEVTNENLDLRVIEALLRRGDGPDVLDHEGLAPLHYAVTHHQADHRIVGMFVKDYKANVNIRLGGLYETPLHRVLIHNPCNNGVALELIRCGAGVNTVSEITEDKPNNSRPLHLAAGNISCDVMIIRELIIHGADVNARCEPYVYFLPTPLHIAARHLRLDVVKELFRYGVDLSAKGPSGNGFLTYVLFCPLTDDFKSMIDIIVESVIHGADVDARNSRNETLLISYLCHGQSEAKAALCLVKTLLDLGADVNAVDEDERNSLHSVLENPNLNTLVVKELLQRGADATKENCFGLTPLHQAILRYEDRREPLVMYCIKLLIKYASLDSEKCPKFISKEASHKFLLHEGYFHYASACLFEIADMKRIEIFDSVSLHTCLTLRSMRSTVTGQNDTDFKSAIEKLLTLLNLKKFPLFSELISLLVISEQILV